MKQTVAILTALTLILTAMVGYLLYGSTREIQLIAQKDQQLIDLWNDVTRLTRERDALNVQLQGAVLSSQEANAAANLQTERNQQLQLELEALRQTLETPHEIPAAP